MKPFILMVTFLTRIPIKIKFDITQEDFRRGIWYMPIVGLLIGGILYAMYLLLSGFVSSLVLSCLLVFLYLMITGGLHIDGLADTMDAFLSNRPKERMLEIMKDPHIGTFGVLGIVMYLIIIIVLLNEVPEICIIFPVAGRSFAMFASYANGYARPQGLGKTIIENTKTKHVVFSFLILILVSFAFQFISRDIFLLYALVTAIALTFILISIITKSMSKKLGGITGDTIGFVIEASSVLFLAFYYVANLIMGLI